MTLNYYKVVHESQEELSARVTDVLTNVQSTSGEISNYLKKAQVTAVESMSMNRDVFVVLATACGGGGGGGSVVIFGFANLASFWFGFSVFALNNCGFSV